MPALRLFPLVAFAALCLLALKSIGMLTGDGFVLTGSAPAIALDGAAETGPADSQDRGEYATGEGDRTIVTGATAGVAKADDPEQTAESGAAASGAAPGTPETASAKSDPAAESPFVRGRASTAQQALLQSLTGRRAALDKRDRELDLRENLLKAAEKRLEARIKELKSLDARIQVSLAKQDEIQSKQFGRLVKIYAQMKPKDAARIFNRLDPEVLIGLVRRMKPDSMSSILGRMDPEVAKSLTADLAARASSRSATNATLPKIVAGN